MTITLCAELSEHCCFTKCVAVTHDNDYGRLNGPNINYHARILLLGSSVRPDTSSAASVTARSTCPGSSRDAAVASEVNGTDLDTHTDTARWVPPSSPAEDIGQRGTLKIGDKVAQRLAVHAAASTPGVCRHAAGLDKLTGRDLPAAQLEISANRAVAQLKVAIAWPHPLAEVARAVQRNVTEALSALAGLDVDRVDVEVTHGSVADTNGAPGRVP